MARYVLIGSGASARPAPKKIAPVLLDMQRDTGCSFNSILRTQGAVSWARSHGAVLSSQKELYDGFNAGLPGYNPANPPGRSTHERRSDGVAYPGPTGRPLFGWQCGFDVNDWETDGCIEWGKKNGYVIFRPYPVGSEYHHLNFQKEPRIKRKDLKRGSKGRRVKKLERRLAFIRDRNGKHYFTGKVDRSFGKQTKTAVRRFQLDHDLVVDGVVGPHTWAVINARFRYQWKKRK